MCQGHISKRSSSAHFQMPAQLTPHLFLAGAAALGVVNGVRIAFSDPAYAGRRATACVSRALRGTAEVGVLLATVPAIACFLPLMWAAQKFDRAFNIPPTSPSDAVVWSFEYKRDI